MAIPFDEILAKMSPEVQERAASLAAKLIARERNRQEIRESLARSQAQVAQALGVEPSAVSELERGGRPVCVEPPEIPPGDGRRPRDHRPIPRPLPRPHLPIQRRRRRVRQAGPEEASSRTKILRTSRPGLPPPIISALVDRSFHPGDGSMSCLSRAGNTAQAWR